MNSTLSPWTCVCLSPLSSEEVQFTSPEAPSPISCSDPPASPEGIRQRPTDPHFSHHCVNAPCQSYPTAPKLPHPSLSKTEKRQPAVTPPWKTSCLSSVLFSELLPALSQPFGSARNQTYPDLERCTAAFTVVSAPLLISPVCFLHHCWPFIGNYLLHLQDLIPT